LIFEQAKMNAVKKMISYHPYTHTLYRNMLKEARNFFDADARFCLKLHIRERFEANATIQSCKLIKWHAIGKKTSQNSQTSK